MTKSAVLILMSISILILLSFSCKDVGVQPSDKSFTLTVEDASCTEVWLKLSITNLANPTITLKRDGIIEDTICLAGADTTIVDENLLPSHTYTYTASLLNGSLASSSTARTMDTTSHSFLWQTFTLGDGSGSSTLYDVAIINDTLAYAVGEIWQGGTTYNLAKWNGDNWQLYQLYYKGNNPIVPIRGILVLEIDDVWLAAGGVFHWDGVSSQAQLSFSRLTLPDPNATVEKVWGTSSSSLYGVGNSGTIVHYSGSSWTKIESGTSLNFQDIFGATNSRTNQLEILAVASQLDINQGNKIVSIQGTTATPVNNSGLSWSIVGVWFLPGRQYYIAGDGVGQKHLLQDANPWTVHPTGTLAANYSESIRGNDINDVIIVGDFGDIVHYNGSTWKSYLNETYIPNGGFGHVAIKRNLVIAVGVNGGKASITMGRR